MKDSKVLLPAGLGFGLLALSCVLLLQTRSLRAIPQQCCGDNTVGCEVMYAISCDNSSCPPAPCCTSANCPTD